MACEHRGANADRAAAHRRAVARRRRGRHGRGAAAQRQPLQGATCATLDRARRESGRRPHGRCRMTTNMSTNAPLVGQPMDRTDGLLKVTGDARYAAEFPEARIAHAVLVTSTISSGSIASIDASRAQSLPGVLLVMTYQNAPRLPNGGRPPLAPPAGRHLSLLQDN